MTEPTLNEHDQYMIMKILGESAIDDDLAREDIEQLLLERDAKIGSLERKLDFAKTCLSMAEEELSEMKRRLKAHGYD